ncbi:MAG TPA: hypothetical protein VF510_22780 [Ktedonobacterales bacterium]
MYVFRARYACLSPRTELDGDPGDMALAVEQELGLALYRRIGVVSLERVYVVAHPTGPSHAFTLHLVVRSPEQGTRIRRASLEDDQQAIEAIVLRLLRELFGPVLVEASELGYEACDAEWGEAVPARSRRR